MAVNDPHFYERLLDLSACLCDKITEKQLPTPCYCGPIAGDQISYDYCTSGPDGNGMAWVRLAGIVEQDVTIPGASSTLAASTCYTPLIGRVEVGVVRCAPTAGAMGELPSAGAHLDSVQLQMADMNAALEAIRCCFNRKDVKIEAWVPIGPGGGCLGGAWALSMFEAM